MEWPEMSRKDWRMAIGIVIVAGFMLTHSWPARGEALLLEVTAFSQLQNLGVARAFELGAVWGSRDGEAATPGQYHLLSAGVEVAGASASFGKIAARVRCTLVNPGAIEATTSTTGLDEWWSKHQGEFEREACSIASKWTMRTVMVLSSLDGQLRPEERPLVYSDDWVVSSSSANTIQRIYLQSPPETPLGTVTLTLNFHLRGGSGEWEADFVGWEFKPAKGGDGK